MSRAEELKQIVRVFSQYGFRKTSMRDLADGLGISRQALYNRFSSKEDVFEWAAKTLIEDSSAACIAILKEDRELRGKISDALHAWVGQYVDLMRASPHSVEIIAMVGDASSEEKERSSQAIRAALAEAIIAHTGAPADRSADGPADGIAYALYMASKGLLGEVESSAAHQEGMARIIAAMPID